MRSSQRWQLVTVRQAVFFILKLNVMQSNKIICGVRMTNAEAEEFEQYLINGGVNLSELSELQKCTIATNWICQKERI